MKNIQCKTHALTYNCDIFPSFQLSGHPSRKSILMKKIYPYWSTDIFSPTTIPFQTYISQKYAHWIYEYIYLNYSAILLHHRNH